MDKNFASLDRNQTLNNTFTVYFSRFLVLFLVTLLLIALPQLILNYMIPSSPLVAQLESGDYNAWMNAFGIDINALEYMDTEHVAAVFSDLFFDLIRNAIGSILLSLAISIFLTPFAVGAIAAVSDSRARGERISLSDALGRAGQRYTSLLVTNICALLFTLGFVILFIIAAFILFLLVGIIASMSGALGVLLFVLLGIGIALPVILIASISNVALCFAVTGERTGFAAASGALKLLFSRFWRHVGLFLMVGIASGLAGWIVAWILELVLTGSLAPVRVFISTGIFGSLSIVAAAMIVFSASKPALTVEED